MMTRTQQTAAIVSSIFIATLFLGWVIWPEPNLDGMDPWERCAYSSFNENRGGTKEKCQEQIANEAAAALTRGY